MPPLGESGVIAERLAVRRLVLDTEITAARFLTGERVETHQLAELQEVGHAAGALQLLVQLVHAAGNGHVYPERFAKRADLVEGLRQFRAAPLRSRTRPTAPSAERQWNTLARAPFPARPAASRRARGHHPVHAAASARSSATSHDPRAAEMAGQGIGRE